MSRRNPRRVVLGELREINRWMRWAVRRWYQTARVYAGTVAEATPGGGQVPRGVWRALEPHERRENDPAEWAELEAAMREVSRRAAAIADYAGQQQQAARARAKSREEGTP